MTRCGQSAGNRQVSLVIIGVVSAHGGAKPNPFVTAARARLGRSASGPAHRPRPAAVG